MGSRKLDRLSRLPDDVLLHILDLIPTKLAVRTSILSKRWRHIWKSVANLHFDDIPSFPDLDSFTKYVDRVLKLRKTTHVKSFRLDFSNLWVPNTTTLKWIHEAVKLNVSELEIHSVLLELPRLFVCKTLTKLTLVCHREWDDWNITSSINLPLLKTLDIQVYTNPTLNAFKLIPGCPLLESLSLHVTTSHESDEYIFNIPTLKQLKLSTSRGICAKKVVLNVPNLEDFFVRGRILSPVVMEGFPPLVSVTLCSGTPDHLWVELLYGISGAKSLSLHTLCKYPSNSPMPNFPNLKHLELSASCYFNPLDWLLLHQILESSSELEYLCIQEMLENPHWSGLEDSCWIEPQSVPTCMLKNLRTIKFANFKGRKSYTQFLAYMLGNAEVLKTLTITCYRYALEEEMWLRAELLKLPRASGYCEIHFIGSQSHSTSSQFCENYLY